MRWLHRFLHHCQQVLRQRSQLSVIASAEPSTEGCQRLSSIVGALGETEIDPLLDALTYSVEEDSPHLGGNDEHEVVRVAEEHTQEHWEHDDQAHVHSGNGDPSFLQEALQRLKQDIQRTERRASPLPSGD